MKKQCIKCHCQKHTIGYHAFVLQAKIKIEITMKMTRNFIAHYR
jgi:hypothetical protein